MPKNKNAQLRYNVLDRCFSNFGRTYTIDDLVDACNNALWELDPESDGVKKRIIYEDIRFMKSDQGWSAPIQSYRYEKGHKTYIRYEDPKFSINNKPLNDAEMQQLEAAMQVLGRFEGMPQFEWVSELLKKVNKGMATQETHKDPIMSFDHSAYLKGNDHTGTLFNAINNSRAVIVTYRSFRREEAETFVFHPWHLRQYNRRWFVFGHRPGYENMTNLGLDRIEKITEADDAYILNTDIDFTDYFDEIVGVTRYPEDKEEKIVLKATKQQADYIRTKPIHGSQTLGREEGEHVIFELQLVPNYELESILLAFGERVEVLAPMSLRERLKERLEETVKLYS
ncbi:helix-turn-helix transcriptional regulator [Robertkochia sediminum]|uniref:helix-turn-helix transcriptional regulator n=1 Tax=Robertkochia sediminum TaxID=2785326 RepID=UPI001932C04D|nr:WYL domain-containing protein [Robertkochia sediminum]MBL7471400.1 WYL domain-containing protein [Robertkochia sediminum]